MSRYEFVLPIATIVSKAGKKFEIKHYAEKFHLSDYSAIILCGTALKDNKFREDVHKFDFLQTTSVPVLGICAGFQIIGLQFGAELSDAKEIGMQTISCVVENKLFDEDINVYNVHGALLQKVDSFSALAKDHLGVQAVKHKNKNVYGIAFHPEVRQEQIIKNFLQLC